MTTSQKMQPQDVTHGLPTLEERPDADVVIYDGHCRFCTAGAEKLNRWDSRNRLAFISLHDPSVAERWPDLTHDRLMEEMVVVDHRGRRHGGAAAFRYLTTVLPRLHILAPLLHIPFTLPLWQWGYRQVAKRRYQIAGKTGGGCDDEGCKIHFR